MSKTIPRATPRQKLPLVLVKSHCVKTKSLDRVTAVYRESPLKGELLGEKAAKRLKHSQNGMSQKKRPELKNLAEGNSRGRYTAGWNITGLSDLSEASAEEKRPPDLLLR